MKSLRYSRHSRFSLRACFGNIRNGAFFNFGSIRKLIKSTIQ